MKKIKKKLKTTVPDSVTVICLQRRIKYGVFEIKNALKIIKT